MSRAPDPRPLPRSVGEALQDLRGPDGVLDALVLTTFAWSPRQAEREILPWLVAGRAVGDEARSDRFLDGLLSTVEHGAALFYDARAFAAPTQLDDGPQHGHRVDHIPVHRSDGCFHPKLVLALARQADGQRALLVACSSANLTRGGWLTNLELMDLDRMAEGAAHGLAAGLSEALEWLETQAGRPVAAVTAVQEFLRTVPAPATPRCALWFSRTAADAPRPLTEAIDAALGTAPRDGALLELAAPFVSEGGLERLWTALPAARLRVRAPTNEAGATNATQPWLDAVEALATPEVDLQWSALPVPEVEARDDRETTPRFVHAKLLRWVAADPAQPSLTVTGSPNHTVAALDGGNVEAAILRWGPSPALRTPWLVAADRAPTASQHPRQEEWGALAPLSEVPLRLRVRWPDPAGEPRVEVMALPGTDLPVEVELMPRAVPIKEEPPVVLAWDAPGWVAPTVPPELAGELLRAPTRYVRPRHSDQPGAPVLAEVQDAHLLARKDPGARPAIDVLLASFLHSHTFRRLDRLLERSVSAGTDEDTAVERTADISKASAPPAFRQLAGALMAHLSWRERLVRHPSPQALLTDLYDRTTGWHAVLEQLALGLDTDASEQACTTALVHAMAVGDALDWVETTGLAAGQRADRHAATRAAVDAVEEAAWAGIGTAVSEEFRAWWRAAWSDPDAEVSP